MIEKYQLNDCKKIQRAFKKHGIDISLHKAQKLWSKHSEGFCAIWESDIKWLDEDNIYEILKEKEPPKSLNEYFYILENRVRFSEFNKK